MNKSIEYQKIFKVTQWQRLYSLEYESVLKINIRVGEMNSDGTGGNINIAALGQIPT